MKRTVVLASILALLLVALFWQHADKPAANITPRSEKIPRSATTAAATNAKIPRPEFPPPTEISHLADALNSPAADIRADLRIVAGLLEAFRTNFPHDGNPVGENVEITAALAGKNSLRFGFLPPNHPAIDADGELCDRWGTPFFFHALSGTRMEIRSAGPDKKLYTADDVTLAP
ncbi:MAG TPA: hypothetical protein VHD62_04650 [Opitutaceae bacterium]|nr:hypothetical protein [Opitutaceae bacterium]